MYGHMKIVSIMLVVAFLLASVSIAYAAGEIGAPTTAGSCCAGFPPCNTRMSKCGWCCALTFDQGNQYWLKLNGWMDISYDTNCNPTVTSTGCGFVCGLGGCEP